MWCSHCQEDVPAATTSGGTKYSCPRCGQALCAEGSPQTASEPQAAEAASETSDSFGERFDFDTWEMDEQLRHIERVLRVEKDRSRRREAVYRREARRLDPAHSGVSPWNVPAVAAAKSSHHQGRSSPRSDLAAGGFFTGACLALGTATLVCGGVLLGWSTWGGRPDLWQFGLPVAVGGQIALLIGLLLQLDRLRREHRSASQKINVVDEELRDLKTTAVLLESAHGPLAGSFYAHYASGANPQLLLSDLKGQLDLLAMKIGQEE